MYIISNGFFKIIHVFFTEENDTLPNNDCWIGLNDRNNEGNLTWLDKAQKVGIPYIYIQFLIWFTGSFRNRYNEFLYHFAVGDAGFCCSTVTIFIIVCSEIYAFNQLSKHENKVLFRHLLTFFLIAPPQR